MRTRSIEEFVAEADQARLDQLTPAPAVPLSSRADQLQELVEKNWPKLPPDAQMRPVDQLPPYTLEELWELVRLLCPGRVRVNGEWTYEDHADPLAHRRAERQAWHDERQAELDERYRQTPLYQQLVAARMAEAEQAAFERRHERERAEKRVTARERRFSELLEYTGSHEQATATVAAEFGEDS